MAERILITGASGYISSNLIPILEKEGKWELHLLSRTQIKSRHAVHVADISDSAPMSSLISSIRPHYVIHLAATGFNYAKKETLAEMSAINFDATKNLINQCKSSPDFKRFIYLTTYMECRGTEKAIGADDALVPQSDYAKSKSLASEYLASLSNSFDSISLRIFSVYGLNDRPFRFIPSIFDAMVNGKSVGTTSLKQKRDFIFITDVARAIVCAIKTPTHASFIYNVGSGVPVALADVATKIQSLYPTSSGKINLGTKPDRPNEAMCYFADISKTEKELGWKPVVSLDEGLKQTKEFYSRSG